MVSNEAFADLPETGGKEKRGDLWNVAISAPKTKLLIINPNSSKDMTEAMTANLRKMNLSPDLEISTYTAPASAPASINDNLDMLNSFKIVSEDIESALRSSALHGVLVACFSRHRLVSHLATNFAYKLLATGIFEAAVLGALAIAPSGVVGPRAAKWGIVTTGAYWEKELAADVDVFLGKQQLQQPQQDGKDGGGGGGGGTSSFAGVFSTGLNAGDFHSVPPEEVTKRLGDATRKLLDKKDVRCVIMGCAGMAGLEEIIRSVAIEKYGELEGREVLVIDSVKAGVMQLEQMVRYNKVFR